MKNLNKVLLSMLVVASTSAMATTGTTPSTATPIQGELVHGLDNTIRSTGKVGVNLKIAHAIQVNNLSDVDFGTFRSGIDSDLTVKEDFCVFTNAAAYKINYTGVEATSTGGFQLTNTTNNALKLPYEIKMATITRAGAKTEIATVKSNNWITNVRELRNRRNCQMSDGYKPNVELTFKITEGVMLDALPGTYNDTVTVVASPE